MNDNDKGLSGIFRLANIGYRTQNKEKILYEQEKEQIEKSKREHLPIRLSIMLLSYYLGSLSLMLFSGVTLLSNPLEGFLWVATQALLVISLLYSVSMFFYPVALRDVKFCASKVRLAMLFVTLFSTALCTCFDFKLGALLGAASIVMSIINKNGFEDNLAGVQTAINGYMVYSKELATELGIKQYDLYKPNKILNILLFNVRFENKSPYKSYLE